MESQMKRLKDEADIKMVVSALGIPYERKGCNYFLKCPDPAHHDEHPSAYFKDGWNNIFCNTCGHAFKAIDVIMMTTGWEVAEAANFLWQLEGRPSWFEASPEERSKFSLTPKEAKFIGIRQGGEAACYCSFKEYKTALLPGEIFDQREIDGYLKYKQSRLSWKDFMSEKEFVQLVMNKAKEKAVEYEQNRMPKHAKKAMEIYQRAKSRNHLLTKKEKKLSA